MLPPPPSARIALWAAVNVLAFRALAATKRLFRVAVRHARRALATPDGAARALGTVPLLAGEARHSLVLERLMMAGDRLRHEPPATLAADRPTAVEVRRAS
ncbi:MAG: hypothetical protein QM820_45745 [Minicystis sp.]